MLGLAGAAVELVDAAPDQAIDAEFRHDVLQPRDADADEAVELAVRVHRERAGADDDGVGSFQAQARDLDIAARRLHLAEALRPRFWREVLKTPEHGVDFALHRLGEQRMQCRGGRRGERQERIDHRIVGGRAADDAALELGVVGREERGAAGAGELIDVRVIQGDGNAVGLGRQPAHAAPRARPIGDKTRRLAGLRDGEGAGDFADQQGGTIDLRRDADVLGADGEWRLGAADRGAGRRAIRLDAERESADGLAAAGIDPAGCGFARDPAGHGAVGDAEAA